LLGQVNVGKHRGNGRVLCVQRERSAEAAEDIDGGLIQFRRLLRVDLRQRGPRLLAMTAAAGLSLAYSLTSS